jgi:hypothetical protein
MTESAAQRCVHAPHFPLVVLWDELITQKVVLSTSKFR